MKNYLLFSIGEITMIMISILLAVQVNNWNERRKNNNQEHEIYSSFLTTLTKDSVDLALISNIFQNGFNAQKYFIENNSERVLKEKSLDEIKEMLLLTLEVSHSFFPRYGIYQEVLNNGEFALIRSDTIKNQLTEIYERRYKLYEHVDATVEEKIHFDLQPVVKGKYQLFVAEKEITSPLVFDAETFKLHYDDLTFQMRSMNSILGSTAKIHGVMSKNINVALKLLREEIDYKH